MKTKIIPMMFVLAALSVSSAFAQDSEEYTVIIDESQELSTLSNNTQVTNNAVLTLTSNVSRNWSLKIDEGSAVYFTASDVWKWGTGTNNHKTAVVENYGTIDMQSNKAFRFGDDGGGYSTTVNLYDGSLMTSSTGTFGIENYRGTNSIVNVYKGASITNLSAVRSFDRADESSENPLFEINVIGGSVSQSGNIDFGNNANSKSETTIQTSKINITEGGTYSSTGKVFLGNVARNDAQINISGEGSTFSTTGQVTLSKNAEATASITVENSGLYIQKNETYFSSASEAATELNVKSGGTYSIESGTLYIANSSNSSATVNVDGGIIAQNSETAKTINFGQGNSSIASLNITNGGKIVENTQVFNINLGASGDAEFTGLISGAGSVLNSSGTVVVGAKDGSIATLDIENGGSLNLIRSESLAGVIGEGNGTLTIGNSGNADATVNVNYGGVLEIGRYLNIGNAADTIAKLNVNEGGLVSVTKETHIYVGRGNGAESTFTIDGGKFSMACTTNDLNIQLNSLGDENSIAKFILTNAAMVKQESGAKNIQLNMYNGESLLEISNGAKWAANTNFYVGRNANSVSTLNVDGGYITGSNESLTSNSSDIYGGAGADTISYVNITNGGIANFRGANISQGHAFVDTRDGGTGAESYVTISGNGSLLAVRMVNNTNYHNRWGVNADAAAYDGNIALLSITTGAQFLNTQNAIQIFDTAQFTFLLDSTGIAYAKENNLPMIKSPKLDIYRTSEEESSPFVLDGSNLGTIVGTEEGTVFEIALISATEYKFNGEVLDFAKMDDQTFRTTITSLFTFKDNVNLPDWKDFDANDISFKEGVLFASLTYVPEPSTYAAILGALALGFVAYRRRK